MINADKKGKIQSSHVVKSTMMIAILVASALVFSPLLNRNAAFGATTVTWDGGGDGINWSDPANWSGDTLPTSSDKIVISHSVTLDIDFTLDSSGTIAVPSASHLGIQDGKSLENDGTINVDEDLGIGKGSILNNKGVINTGKVTIAGTLNNDGVINNNIFLFVIRGNGFTGIINNNELGTIINTNIPGIGEGTGDTIANEGVITNKGEIDSKAGVNFHNRASGTINNDGNIKNECGVVFTNDGTLFGNPVVNEPCPDTTPPTVSITSPNDGDNLKTNQLTIKGTASDNPDSAGVQSVSGVKSVKVTLSGNTPTTPITVSPDAQGQWSVTTTSLSDGSYTIVATATDGAGNQVTTTTIKVTIDTNAPDTKIISAKDGKGNTIPKSGNTHSSKITFTFTGTDNSGGTGVTGFQCLLDGSGSTPFSDCNSQTSQTYTGLKAGTHTFYVRSLDKAGNFDQSPATFKWKINGPVV